MDLALGEEKNKSWMLEVRRRWQDGAMLQSSGMTENCPVSCPIGKAFRGAFVKI